MKCEKCGQLLYRGDRVFDDNGTLYCSEPCTLEAIEQSNFLATKGFRPGIRARVQGLTVCIVSYAYRRAKDTLIRIASPTKLDAAPVEISVSGLQLDLDRLPWIDFRIKQPMDNRQYLVFTEGKEFKIETYPWTEVTHWCELHGPI